MNHFLLSFFLLMSFSLSAKEASFKLLDLDNDWDHKQYELHLNLDPSGQIAALSLYDLDERDWDFYSLDQLMSGVVLKEVQKQKVIVLSLNEIDPKEGGAVKLEYLHNVFTGEYRSFEMTIEFDGQEWGAYFHGKGIDGLFFITNRVVSKAIGIKKVVVR